MANFYSAAEPRSRGALWPSFALARIHLFGLFSLCGFLLATFLWINEEQQQAKLSGALIWAAIEADSALDRLNLKAVNLFRQLCAATLAGLTNLFGSVRSSPEMISISAVMSCMSFVLNIWMTSRFSLGMFFMLWWHPGDPIQGNLPASYKTFSEILFFLGLTLIVSRRLIWRFVWLSVCLVYVAFVVHLVNEVSFISGGRGLSFFIHGRGNAGVFWFPGLIGMGLGVLIDLALLVVSVRLLKWLARTAVLSAQILCFGVFLFFADLLWSLFNQSKLTFFEHSITISTIFPVPFALNADNYSLIYSSFAVASTTNLFFVFMCLWMALALLALIMTSLIRYLLPNVLLRIESNKSVAFIARFLAVTSLALGVSSLTSQPLNLYVIAGSISAVGLLLSLLNRSK